MEAIKTFDFNHLRRIVIISIQLTVEITMKSNSVYIELSGIDTSEVIKMIKKELRWQLENNEVELITLETGFVEIQEDLFADQAS